MTERLPLPHHASRREISGVYMTFDGLRTDYRVVIADPPWDFKSNSRARPGRNARRHYDCLSLADNTFYTGDFAVQAADEVVEIHEVKGFWQDDARVKIKVAASLYPFRFFAVKPVAKKDGGGWKREEF